ncbi:MAG: hypothetical protein Q9209_001941 [Squamulea sp. 1 TL-2023]
MADEFKLITIDEAEKAALKVFDSIFDKRKAIEARINGAKNKQLVRWLDNLYGKDFEHCAPNIKATMHTWIFSYWLPGLLQKYRMEEIKSNDAERICYLSELATWKFLEKVWFAADDFKLHPALVEIVQLFRVRLYGSDTQPGAEHMEEAMTGVLRTAFELTEDDEQSEK